MKERDERKIDPLERAGITLADFTVEELLELWENGGRQAYEEHLESLEMSRHVHMTAEEMFRPIG